MQLKLIYRFLRQVSIWVVDDYYSEVLVVGEENIPRHGPIIIASTHHNEMVDIAALAARLPHGRHLSFWAKASMFKNSIARGIMTSTGAIPVRRNPNSIGDKGKESPSSTASPALSTEDELAARVNLFRETTNVLKNDGVVGIFPEGTSCTGWRVFQTMPGAAWAALEYTRAIQGKEGAVGVRIIPVAITYTDKSKYLSRIHLRYGTPILMDEYVAELLDENADPNVAARSVATKITAEVESRLIQMTVNAVDWETICAINTARQILWTDEDDISLKDWVVLNQLLVASLDAFPDTAPVKQALCQYNALLHYSGFEHSTLTSLLPLSSSPSEILATATRSMLARLPLAIIRLAAFLPSLLFAMPGYFAGPLARALLGKRDEEEGHSQFKAIAGGLGLGPNIVLLFGWLWRLQGAGIYSSPWTGTGLGRFVQVLGATYIGTSLLLRWHNLLVKANYKHLRQIQTYWKLARSSLSGSKRLDKTALEPYTKPPHPVVNRFIKSKYLVDLPAPPPTPPRISAVKLVPDLLDARREAGLALVRHLRLPRNEKMWRILEKKGARLP